MVVLLFTGCEALTMTPDAWLDPYRWEQEDMEKAKLRRSQARDQAETGAQV
jgi:hypothetical protein